MGRSVSAGDGALRMTTPAVDTGSYSVLITSTIFPPPSRDPSIVRTIYSSEERLIHTKSTIASLQKLGYQKLWLLDNSGNKYKSELQKNLDSVNINCFDHYQFNNKGISEAVLLLEGLKFLPDDRPVLKISGRYSLHKALAFDPIHYDIAAKITKSEGHVFRRQDMSTRCYAVKNPRIFDLYMRKVLQEIFGYSSRIVGIRSLGRLLINQLLPAYSKYEFFEPTLRMEFAGISAINNARLKLQRIQTLGLSGYLGAFEGISVEE